MSSALSGAATKPAIRDPGPSISGDTTSPAPVVELTGDLGRSPAAEVLDEKAFTRMLCLERKRTERSGRRFVLMLLESRRLLKAGSNRDGFEQFTDKLCESTRETDVKGWYKDGSVFGVIFTEIGQAENAGAIKVLANKVTTALCSSLRNDDVSDIRLSFHVYPGESVEAGDDDPPDLTLYPDQISGTGPKRVSRSLKRVMDVAGSLFALALLSPIMAAIALAIKLTSPGPVLFRQERVGRYGTTFTFLKFRSMHLANDDTIHKEYVTRFISGQPESAETERQRGVFKLKDDPRVTSIGKVLRRSSLDELPQLLNVLRGEMSLVGPRPALPYEVACYETWHRRRLLIVKPGMTGLWQVGGRSKVRFDEMVRLDLKYAETWSLWLDVKILMKTPAAVVSGEGAY